MKGKILLPAIFVTVFALSRIPGLMPPNFSVAYAFAFCAGVYFPGALAWILPLGVMLVTDVSLNLFYYHEPPFATYLLLNYAIYALLIGLGKLFGRKASLFKLVLGGLTGAVIFYIVTNTLSWLQDAAYTKTFAGWIQALTLGRPDWHPTTWEMFRNTLLSGGLFTALFAAAEKLTAESPAEKTAGAREPAAEGKTEAEPEEAKA
jgi:Ni/Fe-hydrogenase subunit HybB-like protein